MITLEELQKLIESNQAKRIAQLRDWERYKTKQVEIFNRKMPIPTKINNKINHDYVGIIINQKVGHYLGNPISISFDESTDEKVNNLLKFKRYTAFDRVLTELGLQAAIYGYGVALAFINVDGKFDFVEIQPYDVILTDDVGIRFVRLDDKKELLEVYDNKKRYFYQKEENNIIPLLEYNGIKSGVNHLFDKIPLFKFKNNKEELSETYRVRNIINVVDKMYSDLASELEQFRLAYVKITGCNPDANIIEQMAQTGILVFNGENANAEFMIKQVDIAGYLSAIEKEVQNIYKFAQTYDAYQDKNGYGQLTNLGIHFLMAPINNNCRKTIHYFKESLYELFNFYSQTTDGDWLSPLELSFNFILDTPRNILEESQIQKNLEGLVSNETRLKLLTCVDDASKELNRMKKEKEEEDSYEGLGD